ncbi:DMT family transporter [Thalassospira mesophila]|uniref:Amidophosphoribosyltransferase n=1 Tax=Thalassospira mesophila TaxID=1293891 RepID=A0A1Y2L1C2_9PROT|nr:DMT family transporter [Thalassospira mesophila]OSQ38905.1 hypothetical protein TMES_09215 [Thalassospira mesophila]
MYLFYSALALCAGVMLPVQAAMNARLAKLMGSSLWAASFSGFMLTIILALGGFMSLGSLPRMTGAAHVPWWAWVGGVCGCVVLSATTIVAPKIGTSTMIALLVSGQVVCSLLIDSFGVLGMAAHPFDVRRACAAGLLLLATYLLR